MLNVWNDERVGMNDERVGVSCGTRALLRAHVPRSSVYKLPL